MVNQPPPKPPLLHRSGLLLASVLLASACDASEDDPLLDRVESVDAPLPDEPEQTAPPRFDPHDSSPIAGRLDLTAQLPGELLTDDDALPIELTNDTDSPKTVVLTATVYVGGQRHTIALPSDRVDSWTTTALSIPVRSLQLPSGELHTSGQLLVSARLHGDDGRGFGLERQTLYFHPEGDGWRFYDEHTRQAEYHGGLLTAQARALAEPLLGRRTLVGSDGRTFVAQVPNIQSTDLPR